MTGPPATPRALFQKIQAVRTEIARAFVGQDAVVDDIIVALLASGHVLLEGVPGLGKTLLVKAMSRAIGGEFSRIQFTPDLMPSDVSGHAVYDTKTETFSHSPRDRCLRTCCLRTRSTARRPKTQAALCWKSCRKTR